MCPVYSVAVYADGTVVYTGIAHVAQLGVKVLQLEPAAVSSITARAEGSGYFNFEDNYNTRTITDQATITTSIQTDDQFKRIVRYAGDASAPVGLTWVEASIEILVQDLVG
jgi:hypothetical protein